MQPTLFLPLSLSLLLLPSCGKKEQAAPPALPPAAVTYLPAGTETVSITRDLPGRIGPVRVSEVRARVAGILLEKTFKEGSEVKAGDVLFKIDPAPFEAARDSATAALARAEASRDQSKTQTLRVRNLSTSGAVSTQDLDNAEATLKIAEAEVLSAEAAKKTAELNLGYATVTAPISGRIGRADVTEGALVGQGSATLLATIQQLDPIYFDFTQSSADLLALRRELSSGSSKSPETATVTLLLDDGTTYNQPGKLLFSEVSVDETTSMVSIRAEFPNPDRILLPGMFARGRVVQAVRKDAVTVPQRAVTRIQQGKGTVLVVGENDTVQLRTIETGAITGDKWEVTSGLKAGEKVIMEGNLKAKPGSKVVPAPFVPAGEKNPAETKAH